MAREPIHAAGGIVLRGRKRPRIAVVRRSKDDHWVLPRGKLKRRENPIAGAKREVLEETGHRVKKVHEFLGAITYSVRGRPKLVQFWRMQAAQQPTHNLTADITEVRWLPLAAAIRRLSFPLEKLFVRSVGRRALRRRRRKHARRKAVRRTARARKVRRSPARKKSVARSSRKRRPTRRRAAARPTMAPVPAAAVKPVPQPVPPATARLVSPSAAPVPANQNSILRRHFGRS
jgi:8-oxo-dGTP diphosphatase